MWVCYEVPKNMYNKIPYSTHDMGVWGSFFLVVFLGLKWEGVIRSFGREVGTTCFTYVLPP